MFRHFSMIHRYQDVPDRAKGLIVNRKQFLIHTFNGALAWVIAPCLPGMLRAETESAPEKLNSPSGRSELIAAAREIIASQQYCALVTQDEEGRAQVRTVNPFPPEEDMAVWIATGTQTRKVQQIRHNAQVTLYYADHSKAAGFVSIRGKALLVDDRAEMIKRKRGYWDSVFPEFKNLILIKVIPEHLEVLNYSRGVNGDPATWHAPSVEFTS
jgi:general stress protein 26